MDLDPPLCVGHLKASVLCSDRMGLKEQLIQGLWLTQVRGAHSGRGLWLTQVRMWGKSAVAEAGMMLQQPEVCCVFSRGSCPWIMVPWQWQAAQPPGKSSVESDLCLHTGFLLAAAAALASHALLCGPC